MKEQYSPEVDAEAALVGAMLYAEAVKRSDSTLLEQLPLTLVFNEQPSTEALNTQLVAFKHIGNYALFGHGVIPRHRVQTELTKVSQVYGFSLPAQARSEFNELTTDRQFAHTEDLAVVSTNVLVSRAQQNDAPAFAELVSRTHQYAFSIAIKMTRGNRDDAVEIVQESYVKIQKSIGSFRGEAKFSTWMFAVVRKSGLTYIQRQKRHSDRREPGNTSDEIDSLDEVISPSASYNPEQGLAHSQIQTELIAALGQLSEKNKEAIVLHDIGGFSFEEIAKILDISVSAAKLRAFRARRRLLEHLPKDLLDTE